MTGVQLREEGTLGDGAVFGRRRCIAGRSGESVAGRWDVVIEREVEYVGERRASKLSSITGR